jgi:hypothetical protein
MGKVGFWGNKNQNSPGSNRPNVYKSLFHTPHHHQTCLAPMGDIWGTPHTHPPIPREVHRSRIRLGSPPWATTLLKPSGRSGSVTRAKSRSQLPRSMESSHQDQHQVHEKVPRSMEREVWVANPGKNTNLDFKMGFLPPCMSLAFSLWQALQNFKRMETTFFQVLSTRPSGSPTQVGSGYAGAQ